MILSCVGMITYKNTVIKATLLALWQGGQVRLTLVKIIKKNLLRVFNCFFFLNPDYEKEDPQSKFNCMTSFKPDVQRKPDKLHNPNTNPNGFARWWQYHAVGDVCQKKEQGNWWLL